MIDAIIIDGKRYYQVADLRRDLGVTSLDYPLKKAKIETFLLRGTSGQLCRMLDEDGYSKLMEFRSRGTKTSGDDVTETKTTTHGLFRYKLPRSFESELFGTLRIVMDDDDPWFIGKDVAMALGYKNTKDAISSHVVNEDKRMLLRSEIATLENNVSLSTDYESANIPNRGVVIINESGLYSLILSSQLPSARQFQRWVTKEVLGSIRKHGAYMTPQTLENALLDPDFLIQLATKLKEEQAKNKMLMEQNANLDVTNKALTKNTRTWKSRAIVTALVRKVASKSGNNFQMAWNKFYKELQYKKSIYLNKREGNGHMIDKVKEDEWPDLVEVATAMCEALGINAAEVINEVNAAH